MFHAKTYLWRTPAAVTEAEVAFQSILCGGRHSPRGEQDGVDARRQVAEPGKRDERDINVAHVVLALVYKVVHEN